MITATKVKCFHCNATENLTERTVYVGGQGYIKVIECESQIDCWYRWDRKDRELKKG